MELAKFKQYKPTIIIKRDEVIEWQTDEVREELGDQIDHIIEKLRENKTIDRLTSKQLVNLNKKVEFIVDEQIGMFKHEYNIVEKTETYIIVSHTVN